MHALIIGGGIGGLTTALCLQKIGWEVTVLEQSASFESVGAGIQLSPNACKVLNHLGLLGAVESRAFAPECIEMRAGRSGRRIFSIPLKDYAIEHWAAPYLHIHRAELIQILLGAAEQKHSLSIVTNFQFEHFEVHEKQVAAYSTQGEAITADLLVGADGLHSKTRQQIHGPDQPRYTGNVAWRTTVPLERLKSILGDTIPPPSACVWVGAGKHAVTYRVSSGQIVNFVGVVEQRQWSSESWLESGDHEDALQDFMGWHPTIVELIKAADTLNKWALAERPPFEPWFSGPVALLGDACHPMLPFMAQGAAMAMEDACVLAGYLDNEADVETALPRYQQHRYSRTSAVQATSRANAKHFHRPGYAYFPVWLLARCYPEYFHRRQDWLYQYDPTAVG